MPQSLAPATLLLPATLAALLIIAPSVAAQDLPDGWSPGPTIGRLGSTATVAVPADYFFLDARATKRFLEETENIPDGDELGAILRPLDNDYWFAIFSYDDTGYIDDGERDQLDAAALLASLREGNQAANAERRPSRADSCRSSGSCWCSASWGDWG